MNRSNEGAAGATTALTVAMGTSFLLGYVLNVALLWLLSPAEVGIYGVITALMNLLSLVIIGGIPWSVAKILSEETSSVNWARAFKSAVVFNLLVALGICLGFGSTVVFLLDITSTYLTSVPFIVLMLLILAVRLPYERALQGFFRFNQLAAMQVLLIVFRTVFVVVLVLAGFGVPGVLSGMTIASFLSLLIVAFWLRDFRYWETSGWLNIRVLTFALPMFIWFAGMNILQNADLLGVKLFAPADTSDETTGYYQSAVTIARAPFFPCNGVFDEYISIYIQENGRWQPNVWIPCFKVLVLFDCAFEFNWSTESKCSIEFTLSC
ncbi:hypothetical protein FIM02_01975 [SAR202 cluster bacterium AD-802-E10_MRT_200m]|nr:hypothetical protein [SAR202 cluster bacterium AD-802-E10_MRT_200m]MQF82914.1 hypothetical protein [SAR202 cluster bacterium AD-802-E10_MRT_200m]